MLRRPKCSARHESGFHEIMMMLVVCVLIAGITGGTIYLCESQARRQNHIIDRLQAFYQAELAGRALLFQTLGPGLTGPP